MVRKATQADLDALVKFRCATFGSTPTAAAGWLLNVAGLDNIFLVTQEPASDAPAAMLCALPVQCMEHRGVLFCGMATQTACQGRGLMTKLLSGCLRAFAAGDCDFALTAQISAHNAAKLASLGFAGAFPLRVVDKPISRNLWAQADFDNLTVKRLIETRLRYQPGCVCLSESSMAEAVTQMYAKGMTLVSSARGYGLYYQQEPPESGEGPTLQFVELQADNDHSADVLLQAAREKTGAERARIVLAESQALYLGEGRRCGYAMIRFLQKPFSVRDAYFRLLLGE